MTTSTEHSVPGLKQALDQYAEGLKQNGLWEQAGFVGSVTILGDKNLPYDLLKRIMFTCQQANFTKIALAVNQVEGV